MNRLPDGWITTTVGESATLQTGFPFASLRFSQGGIRLLRGSNVKRGALDWARDITRYWPVEESTLRSFCLREGDLVVAMDGALVGRSFARVSHEDLPAYLVQRVARLRGTSIEQGLLYQWVGSDEFVKHVDSSKTHTAIPHISPRDLRDFTLLIPVNPREQGLIGDALEDADRLIGALERAIAKKRAIKQGMMQELLTGRTRLPGFAEVWRVSPLGSLLRVRNGRSQRDVEVPSGRYPILATGGQIGRTDTPIYSKPSVLIGRKGTIDRPQFREEPFWTVDTLFYTEIGSCAEPRYMYYLFATIDWQSMNEATGVPSLTGKRIEAVEVLVPSRAEQQAIAAILHDADCEIQSLRRRLKSTRAIKRGMMQELLTGRTRLMPKEASV